MGMEIFFNQAPHVIDESYLLWLIAGLGMGPLLSHYIKANSKKGDKIVVLGSEPQIYFYCGRHSATGHI
jgi:hypothetical protein